MNLVERSEISLGVTPRKIDKLAALKKAIAEGAYRVKAEEIAGKIIQRRLFELAMTLSNRKVQQDRVN